MTNFFVEPKTLKIRDTDISVSPLAVKNISKAAKCAAPIMEALTNGVSPQLVLENADVVIQLCALATNQTEEFIGELNAAELIALLTVVVEVNGDFFIQTVMPQALSMMETVKKLSQVPQQKDGKKA